MNNLLSDTEISNLLTEQKQLPRLFRPLGTRKEKRGHYESEITLTGSDGHTFQIRYRQNTRYPTDFSVILLYQPERTNIARILRRYNGKSHEHTNKIERNTFYNYHIHTMTERYQREDGCSEDGYAEETERYSTAEEAIDCLIEDCSVRQLNVNKQLNEFGGA